MVFYRKMLYIPVTIFYIESLSTLYDVVSLSFTRQTNLYDILRDEIILVNDEPVSNITSGIMIVYVITQRKKDNITTILTTNTNLHINLSILTASLGYSNLLE